MFANGCADRLSTRVSRRRTDQPSNHSSLRSYPDRGERIMARRSRCPGSVPVRVWLEAEALEARPLLPPPAALSAAPVVTSSESMSRQSPATADSHSANAPWGATSANDHPSSYPVGVRQGGAK